MKKFLILLSSLSFVGFLLLVTLMGVKSASAVPNSDCVIASTAENCTSQTGWVVVATTGICGPPPGPDTGTQVCCCQLKPDSTNTVGTETKSTKLDNPLGDNIKSPQDLVGQVINTLFGVVGSLALVMFIYGGFLWMTSAGSSEKVKKGRDIFIWAAVGLVIVFSAYNIVRFVIQGIGS